MSTTETTGSNFIRKMIEENLRTGKQGGRVITRFPPEPNGFLHIGHAKSICLNFGLAQEYGGACNLRFDDTNPSRENEIFVEAIKEDVRWLGFDWGERLYHASDYFEQLYNWAVQLIQAGKAYVDNLSAEEIRQYRGTLKEPGRESPHRNRSVEENMELFSRMRQGEFADGEAVLRAKIDMRSGNLNLRDPVMYRVMHKPHQRSGNAWCIYPMYDYAHGQSDAIEEVSHSLCTLEFSDHRPLYEWFLDAIGIAKPRPEQTEFARLNLSYTVLSKRRLIQLVEEGHVSGWDDPRMPTIAGLRRRGYTSQAIRDFAEIIGVAKKDSMVDVALLEHCLRQDLNQQAARVMAVLKPLKVIISNYPEDQIEEVEAVNNPEDPSQGSRMLPFSRELYIEHDDFMENPPKKFFRLAPGREVRLMHGYYITCDEVIKDKQGNIIALHCRYDPATKGGDSPDGRKVKGTLHWLCAKHALDAEVRMYDHLFSKENPNDIAPGQTFTDNLNPDSLRAEHCKVEASLAHSHPGQHFQFMRQGYFVTDLDSHPEQLVFNRTVGLKDTWAKIQRKG